MPTTVLPRVNGRLRPSAWKALLALPVLALAACGGEDRLPVRADGPAPLRISVTDSPSGEFQYTAPKVFRGGLVEIRFANRGDVSHKAQVWRVGEGHTVEQALRAGRPLPGWLATAGGVGATRPGETGRTFQRLSPGRYYVAGSGNERGTVAQIRVTATGRPTEPPAARASIVARDYDFRVSGLRAGTNAVEFRNTGAEPHHAYFAPLRRGATLDDVRAALSGSSGPPPVDFDRARETVVLEGGDEQTTELELEPGRYALLCVVSDRAGGPPHTQKGMLARVRVR
ncbi:hypothetical protein BH20ACT19_BH20ACT19_10600 [soil metagenome]